MDVELDTSLEMYSFFNICSDLFLEDFFFFNPGDYFCERLLQLAASLPCYFLNLNIVRC